MVKKWLKNWKQIFDADIIDGGDGQHENERVEVDFSLHEKEGTPRMEETGNVSFD